MNSIKPFILFFIFFFSFFLGASCQVLEKAGKDTILLKVDTLQSATVKASLRPKIKEDTIEYNTSRIKLRPNAMVEELLQILPGLQIDINGNITYNGEKIDHLLVDGEDIFGSTPSLVTRNFDASKIASVQVLDRKSDKTLFTGIDDGTRVKTINLVMKESAKEGYFGKAEAGNNFNGYYMVDGTLAAFKDKEQLTALGIASNTGVAFFSNSGSGGAIGLLGGPSDPLGAFAGLGIPRFETAALHYSNIWNDPNRHVTGNYEYGQDYSQAVATTNVLQIEPDSVYGQSQKANSTNVGDQHWIHAIYDWPISHRSAIQMTVDGNLASGHNQYSATGVSTFNDTLVNSSDRCILDNDSREHFNTILAWRTGVGKSKDRIFSIYSTINVDKAMAKGYLYSVDQFFQPNGVIESVDTINQRKVISDNTINAHNSVQIYNPILNNFGVGLNYGFDLTEDKPLQGTYNRGDGTYKDIVDSLSSNLHSNTFNQQAGVTMQGKFSHLTYTIAENWFGYYYRQSDLTANSALQFRHSNWLPFIMMNYYFSTQFSLRFNYAASIQEPSSSQLEPVKNNNNPLMITLGNPTLKPAIGQAFSFDLQRFTLYFINAAFNMNFANNSISTKIVTDSLGHQISQPVNVPGGKTFGLNLSASRKVLGIDVGLHTNANYSQSVTYINAGLSWNNVYTGGIGASVNKNLADKYSLKFEANINYFNQVSSINTAATVHYLTQSHSCAITIFLIKHFEVNTSATYSWQQKASTFSPGTSVLLWNSSVSRNFLHDKLTFKCQLNNILNQNAAINRSNIGNVITQNSNNILGRYWMFSMMYHFDHPFKHR